MTQAGSEGLWAATHTHSTITTMSSSERDRADPSESESFRAGGRTA